MNVLFKIRIFHKLMNNNVNDDDHHDHQNASIV